MRRLRVLWVVWIGLLIGATPVWAGELLEGDQCTITADQTITGTLFALCRDLVIAGHVQGDLFALAVTAQITGPIDGDLYIGGGRFDISATIGGDVHFGGAGLDLLPGTRFTDPDANLITGSLSTQLSATPLPGNAIGIGYQLLLEGDVGGEVNFWGTALEIGGRVNGDVYAEVGDPASRGVLELGALLSPLAVTVVPPGLRVLETAAIDGQLTYRSVAAGEIRAALTNEPLFVPYQPAIVVDQPVDLGRGLQTYFTQVAREFITLALLGLLALVILPRSVQAPLNALRWRPLPALGIGLLAFILSFPIFLIMIAISVVLVLLVGLAQISDLTAATGIILGVVNFSGAGLFYFVAIFIARAIVGLAIGRLIVRWLWKDSASFRAWAAALVIGVLVLALVASLPLIGWILNALAAFLGLGAILTYWQRQLERARDNSIPPTAGVTVGGRIPTGAPPLPSDPLTPPRLGLPAPPMPALEADPPSAPGLENLPDGFKWWE